MANETESGYNKLPQNPMDSSNAGLFLRDGGYGVSLEICRYIDN
jgi:hypothetical protein